MTITRINQDGSERDERFGVQHISPFNWDDNSIEWSVPLEGEIESFSVTVHEKENSAFDINELSEGVNCAITLADGGGGFIPFPKWKATIPPAYELTVFTILKVQANFRNGMPLPSLTIIEDLVIIDGTLERFFKALTDTDSPLPRRVFNAFRELFTSPKRRPKIKKKR